MLCVRRPEAYDGGTAASWQDVQPAGGSCRMEVRSRSTRVTVVTFPAEDAVFAERVRESLERLEKTTERPIRAAELEVSLRPVHPRVSTSWRDSLAGFGDQVLYVFRDGSAVSLLDDDRWIGAPDTAVVVTDVRGQYLDANDATAELFGASRD